MHPAHKYDAVDLSNHERDSDSITEVEESLIGDEKRWHHDDLHTLKTRPSKKSRCLAVLKSFSWTLNTVLLLAITALLLRDQSRRSSSITSEHEVGGDLTGVTPSFGTQITTFKINQTFAPYNTSEFFKPEVLDAWNSLMPKGMGFHKVHNPEKYHDLPHPIMWDEGTVFTTSMTHQLHCLYAIVQTYSGLTSNTTIPDDHHWHMIHCFDYMRQAIMCSSDMALEGLETTFPDHNGGSDGWDSKHICRDRTQVVNYLESVRAYDDREIF